MATRPDTSAYTTFPEIAGRLEDIVLQVRDRDVSLEHSLDLFDEAIALGSKAVSLVDSTDFSPEEEGRLGALPSETRQSEAEAAPDAAVASDEAPGESQGKDTDRA